jgi:hypothetical protein
VLVQPLPTVWSPPTVLSPIADAILRQVLSIDNRTNLRLITVFTSPIAGFPQLCFDCLPGKCKRYLPSAAASSPERRGSPHDPKADRRTSGQTLAAKRSSPFVDTRLSTAPGITTPLHPIHQHRSTSTVVTRRHPLDARAPSIRLPSPLPPSHCLRCHPAQSTRLSESARHSPITTKTKQSLTQTCYHANAAHASTSSVGHPSRALQLSAQRLTRRRRHYGSCGPAGQ